MTELLEGPRQRAQEEPPRAEGDQCGTYAEYQRHYKRGEKPCRACTHAHSVYTTQWRVRSGKTKKALVPLEVLGALLLAAPTELEEWVEERLGDTVITRAIELASRIDDQAAGISNPISTSSDTCASRTAGDSGGAS